MATADDGDAVVVSDGLGCPARADGAAEALADDLAAAHDDRRRAAAGTGGAGADDDPRAVEIAAASSAAASRVRSSRLLGVGRTSARGPFGFSRARTGE